MNTNHYPDIEQCKKLTEIGFPKTENIMQVNKEGDSRTISQEVQEGLKEYKSEYCLDKCDYLEHHEFGWFSEFRSGYEGVYKFHSESDEYRCPSVMEMLDVIPKYLNDNGEKFVLAIQHQSFNGYIVDYSSVRDFLKSYKDFMVESKTLPNALADLIFWLHENNYIKF